MILILRVDGKKVVLNTDTDERLYMAPQSPPDTGIAYTRGTDYYLHRTKNGKKIFYDYHWSMWSSENDWIEVLSEAEARSRLEERVGSPYGLEKDEIKKCLELWPDFMEEEA